MTNVRSLQRAANAPQPVDLDAPSIAGDRAAMAGELNANAGAHLAHSGERLAHAVNHAAPVHFDAFFATHFSYVWRTLARLGIPDADREDLANEVFFQAHKRFATLDHERPIRPWLFAFAFRIASTHRRLARHRYERAGDLPDAPDSAPSAHETMERREAQGVVEQALSDMDLDQRAVFVLHEIDGFAVPEIATALAIPLNTAYSRLRLARAHFTTKVKRIANERGRK